VVRANWAKRIIEEATPSPENGILLAGAALGLLRAVRLVGVQAVFKRLCRKGTLRQWRGLHLHRLRGLAGAFFWP
jgi:hypothetical protein